jgi:hypothetical protein
LLLRRVYGALIEFESAPWIHDAVVMAVADEQWAFDTIGSAFQRKFFNFVSCFFEILGTHELAQAILDGRVIIKNIID